MKREEISVKVVGIILLIQIVISSIFFLIYIQLGPNIEVDELQRTINELELELETLINDNAVYQTQERLKLEEQIFENLLLIQDELQNTTNSLQLDLGSKLSLLSTSFDERISTLEVESKDFTLLIPSVLPSVVSVQTDGRKGSGVFIDEEGYIITNHHVIKEAEYVYVTLYSGEKEVVDIIAVDEELDLALLKVDKVGPYSHLKLSDSVADVGQRVIAVGNPKGLSFSVTEGVISSNSRTVDHITGDIVFLQTDTAINSGNSGGPLISKQGEIVGINSWVLTNAEGLNFALLSTTVNDFAVQHIDFSK